MEACYARCNCWSDFPDMGGQITHEMDAWCFQDACWCSHNQVSPRAAFLWVVILFSPRTDVPTALWRPTLTAAPSRASPVMMFTVTMREIVTQAEIQKYKTWCEDLPRCILLFSNANLSIFMSWQHYFQYKLPIFIEITQTWKKARPARPRVAEIF